MLRSTSLTINNTLLQRYRNRWRGWPAVFLALCLVPLLMLALLPWSFEGKSLAVLHGICSQQPTHSFYFGDSRLPFGSRMTGIYGGFGTSCLFLLARGRWRSAGMPSASVLVSMAVFVGVMGIDGMNSTLKDVGLLYAYEPQNELRILTGLLTGVSLALFIWLLIGQVAFAPESRRLTPVVKGYRELGLLLVAGGIYAAVVLTTWPPLHIPISVLLVGSAVAVLTGLMLAFVLLIARRENEAIDTWALAGPATLALVLAFGLLATTSLGRFALEATMNIPANPPA